MIERDITRSLDSMYSFRTFYAETKPGILEWESRAVHAQRGANLGSGQCDMSLNFLVMHGLKYVHFVSLKKNPSRCITVCT